MDPFRTAYRELSEEEKASIAGIKAAAGELYTKIDAISDNRGKSIAKTKLEEAVMWAVKGITG